MNRILSRKQTCNCLRLQWNQLFTERKHVEVGSKAIREQEGKGRRGRSRVSELRGDKEKKVNGKRRPEDESRISVVDYKNERNEKRLRE